MKKIIAFVAFLGLVASCEKERITNTSDTGVWFSVDGINFDTLFTTTGSTTKQFKIYNDGNRKVVIDEISLQGNTNSLFHIVADGQSGPALTNIEVGAHDSIYVFVSVTINPSEANLPFVVADTLKVVVDGTSRLVPLSAWGQNAIFLRSKIIATDTTWTNELPVAITGGVLVAKGATLEIEEGTDIYLHADAPLIVEGRLMATGNQADSGKVVFQGDRLDEYYRDLPGSWPGIYFTSESSGSRLENVIIKNAYQGIAAEGSALPGDEKVLLSSCMIFNCYDAGIVALNSSIEATNSIVYNCGRNIIVIRGGRYKFVHCTVAATGNAYVPHKQPVLTLANFSKEDDVFSFGETKASFVNCIFWGSNGSVEDEVVVLREGAESFDVSFSGCLWKIREKPASVTVEDVIENQDPLFIKASNEVNDFNLQPREGSPVINEGVPAGVPFDYNGRARVNVPDIGAFESTF